MKMRLLLLAFLWCGTTLIAQDYFPENDGVKSKNNNYTAFTNAKIYVTPTQIIDGATLLIYDGKVIQVGKSVSIPKNSVVTDLKGKSIYPSFIDPYSKFGVEQPKRKPGGGRTAQYDPSREGFYWNDHIMPENGAITKFKYVEKDAKVLRDAGFGVVNSHIQDGIVRGTGVLVALNSAGNDANRILDDKSAQYLSFSKSVTKQQSYPTSLMGAMSLLRQMYSDAKWYAAGNVDTKDRSLEALNDNQGLIQIFEAKDKGNAIRADKIGDTNGIQYVILGGGNEYERIADIKATGAKFIIPLNFPDAYDVSNPYAADMVALKDMRHWNLAPTNLKVMADNGIAFSLTAYDLKSPAMLKAKLMKAISYGLPKTKALEALTIVPADILGKSGSIGSLQVGRQANFLITSGDIFDKETTIYENWVQGTQNIINDKSLKDIRGKYNLSAGGTTYKMSISGEVGKPKVEIKQDTSKLKSKISYKDDWLQLSFATDKGAKSYRMTGLVGSDDNLNGKLVLPNGNESTFKATKTSALDDKKKDKEKASKIPEMVSLTYPNVGFGLPEKPRIRKHPL